MARSKFKKLKIVVCSLIVAMSVFAGYKPMVVSAQQTLSEKQYELNGVTVKEYQSYTNATVTANGSIRKRKLIEVIQLDNGDLISSKTSYVNESLGWNYWYFERASSHPDVDVLYTVEILEDGSLGDPIADRRGSRTKVMGKYYSGCEKDYAEGMYDPAGHRKVVTPAPTPTKPAPTTPAPTPTKPAPTPTAPTPTPTKTTPTPTKTTPAPTPSKTTPSPTPPAKPTPAPTKPVETTKATETPKPVETLHLSAPTEQVAVPVITPVDAPVQVGVTEPTQPSQTVESTKNTPVEKIGLMSSFESNRKNIIVGIIATSLIIVIIVSRIKKKI